MEKPSIRFLFLTISLCLSSLVYSQSQHLEFQHLGPAQGLSQSNVICILQDSRGFMWFGTREGLNKYDGYKFSVYKNNAQDDKSLGGNQIMGLAEDDRGFIWIGCWGGGLNRYDRRSDQFTRFRHDPSQAGSLSSNLVTAVLRDSRGIIWVGTEDAGLNRLDSSTGRFESYSHSADPSSLSNNYVKGLYEDAEHNIWIATVGGGLELFNRFNKTFTHFRHDKNNPGSLGDDKTSAVFEDGKHRIWVGTDEGLDMLDRKSGVFTHYRKSGPPEKRVTDHSVLTLAGDGEGNLWIGTENDGLLVLDSATGQCYHYLHDDIDRESLGMNSIWAIYKDSKKNMWVGSFTGGVDLVNRDAHKFIHYKHNSSPNSLGDNHVLSIYEDQQEGLWIGTDGGGLDLFDRKAERFTHYRHQPGRPNSLGGDYVLKVMGDSKGNLWIGTWGDGVTVFNPRKNTYTHFRNDPDRPSSLSNNNAWTIFEDRAHRIWVGTHGGGLDLYDPEHGGFVHFQHNPNEPGSLSNDKVHAILEDRQGRLWIGTQGGGLNLFNPQTKQFAHYRHSQGTNSLSNDYVEGLFEDRTGDLWVSTTAGLNYFRVNANQFSAFTTSDGLPDDMVFGVLDDSLGNLWISTNKGLTRMDPVHHHFRNFGVSDGLQANEFKEKAFCKSRMGTLYFGGINGFNEVSPSKLHTEPFDPPLVMTNFEIFNKEVPISGKGEERSPLSVHITETQRMTLPYKSSVFSFFFASLNYTDQARKNYAYMLEGFDKNWNYVRTEHVATYTNLDPAQYTFLVRGTNNDGEWSDKILSIHLTITPPFWMTWWFRLLVMLFVIAGGISFYRWRMYTINALNRQLERQVQERTERLASLTREERKARHEAEEASKAKSVFLATMSHEIRTPMNGVIGMANLLAATNLSSQQKEYNTTILNCGESLLNVINDILDYSKIDSGKMEIEQQDFDLRSCIEGVLDVFHEKVMKSGLGLAYVIREEVPSHLVGDALRLRQILMNLVSNAVKFTQRGEIFLEVRKLRDEANGRLMLAFDVRDTGIGIPADKIDMLFKSFSQVDSSTTRKYGGTGLGLAICEKLVSLMGGEISVKSRPGEGTEFTFSLLTRPASRRVVATPKARYEPPVMKSDFARQFPLRILIAEDNEINQQLIMHILANLGYEPDSVENGERAVSAARGKEYDIILMDVQMPELDGLEATRMIRQRHTKQPAIIALTANAMQGDREACLEAGMDDYISKPVRLDELMRILQKWAVETVRK